MTFERTKSRNAKRYCAAPLQTATVEQAPAHYLASLIHYYYDSFKALIVYLLSDLYNDEHPDTEPDTTIIYKAHFIVMNSKTTMNSVGQF